MLLLVYVFYVIALFNSRYAEANAYAHEATAEEIYKLAKTPAMWGDSVPDYSSVHLESSRGVYLYALIFVDLKIVGAWNRCYGNMPQISVGLLQKRLGQ